jgi:hypothetical protein
MSTTEQEEKRELAYYSAAIAAWFSTRMEHDKSLLTLSSAGIGLLITLATKSPVSGLVVRAFYAAALLGFLLCLMAVLLIYKQNSKHIEAILQNEERQSEVLGFLDKFALAVFGAAIVLSCLFGLALATSSPTNQEQEMSQETKSGQSHLVGDSFKGASAIRPTPNEPLSKSFNGAANLRPAPAAPQTTAGPQTSTSQQQGTPVDPQSQQKSGNDQ